MSPGRLSALVAGRVNRLTFLECFRYLLHLISAGRLPAMLPLSRRLLLVMLLAGVGCQDYPFELRPAKRVVAVKHTEVVGVTKPTDILFVMDNSGTMKDEQDELVRNVGRFIDELVASDIDFQVGIITPDVECNLPNRDCTAGGHTSSACCNLAAMSPALPVCTDEDTDADTLLDKTNCDGGRLRSSTGKNRIFKKPSAALRAQWVQDFSDTIASLGTRGSSYESGLEAVTRAVSCALDDGCVDPPVAVLNKGFVRDGADLVIIFLTDEDDCSFVDGSYYERPANAADFADPLYQETHLCSPNECYGYWGADLNADADSQIDWCDPQSGARDYFRCSGNDRVVNPPFPDPVSGYLDRLVSLLGGDVSRIRAAGIISGVTDANAELGFRDDACVQSVLGQPSTACGCLITSPKGTLTGDFFCELTSILPEPVGEAPHPDTATPVACEAMPGGRYVSFLRELAKRRVEAGLRPDVLIDSICQARYDETLYRIVNNVILTSCFDLGEVPGGVSDISVSLNESPLPNVPAGSDTPGWSWVEGSTQICLEGGLTKSVKDRFEIFVIGSGS